MSKVGRCLLAESTIFTESFLDALFYALILSLRFFGFFFCFFSFIFLWNIFRRIVLDNFSGRRVSQARELRPLGEGGRGGRGTGGEGGAYR